MSVVDDACATVTSKLHEASLDTLRDRYARVSTVEEVLEELQTIGKFKAADAALAAGL